MLLGTKACMSYLLNNLRTLCKSPVMALLGIATVTEVMSLFQVSLSSRPSHGISLQLEPHLPLSSNPSRTTVLSLCLDLNVFFLLTSCPFVSGSLSPTCTEFQMSHTFWCACNPLPLLSCTREFLAVLQIPIPIGGHGAPILCVPITPTTFGTICLLSLA